MSSTLFESQLSILCSLDPSILPELEERLNTKTGLKVVFSSFQAFKFPDRDNLHLQCKVLVCNRTCPLSPCQELPYNGSGGAGAVASARRTRQGRMSRWEHSGQVLRGLEVYNSVEVKTSSIDVDSEGLPLADSVTFLNEDGGESGRQLVCLSSSKMAAVLGVLAVVLVASLVTSICIQSHSQRLGSGLSLRARGGLLGRPCRTRAPFPYGHLCAHTSTSYGQARAGIKRTARALATVATVEPSGTAVPAATTEFEVPTERVVLTRIPRGLGNTPLADSVKPRRSAGLTGSTSACAHATQWLTWTRSAGSLSVPPGHSTALRAPWVSGRALSCFGYQCVDTFMRYNIRVHSDVIRRTFACVTLRKDC
ncbi:hypothetical protein HPB47_011015 [Ixodes persulcatus]|uniref:Uncharacterized protein n=1 Tax=Ixodes persulcatus TaxID=34615 RepID=A0AC60NYA3_IXOPE|nr:hypothetical protein HPB47_011015 [Ixodes persulcatus]